MLVFICCLIVAILITRKLRRESRKGKVFPSLEKGWIEIKQKAINLF